MILRLEQLYGLAVAILLGGAIGMERELKGKAAGLRTNILICMGATLFTQLSMAMSAGTPDKGRIAAQIVTGVGFLGAGTILHGKGSITGLTSAATIWLVAAIGTAAGAGEVYLAAGATLISLLVLRSLGWMESYLRLRSEVSKVTVEVEADPRRVEEVEQLVRRAGLDIEDLHSEMVGNKIVVGVTLRGPKHAQDQARLALLRASGAYTISVEE
ncbi:MAG: MgtC/SapB family protein [Gemmatimonadetes bacterium]|nr:MgtC/SapB family protein [Gemmatimonadota bacterium]